MFEKLKSLFTPEQKALPNLPMVSLYNVGQPYWAPRNYLHFARAGFSGNAIAYRSVRMIAEAAASVPLVLYKGQTELTMHPFLDLLRQPNPAIGQRELIESVVSYLLVSGNSYLEVGEEIGRAHV